MELGVLLGSAVLGKIIPKGFTLTAVAFLIDLGDHGIERVILLTLKSDGHVDRVFQGTPFGFDLLLPVLR